jgi:hypothetical protein
VTRWSVQGACFEVGCAAVERRGVGRGAAAIAGIGVAFGRGASGEISQQAAEVIHSQLAAPSAQPGEQQHGGPAAPEGVAPRKPIA